MFLTKNNRHSYVGILLKSVYIQNHVLFKLCLKCSTNQCHLYFKHQFRYQDGSVSAVCLLKLLVVSSVGLQASKVTLSNSGSLHLRHIYYNGHFYAIINITGWR